MCGWCRCPKGSRLDQVIQWLKRCPDGSPFIALDECHRAKNLVPEKGTNQVASQTGLAVDHLQADLPLAKVLYSSATGASEPRNLAYMTRLGMFGFEDTAKMIELLEKSKKGALELAAMSLKATGTYLARSLSYDGAEFSLFKVNLNPEFQIW